MSNKPEGESEYAQKVRRGDRMYGPCRCGPYDDSVRREIEDVKYWVARIRHRADDMNRAVTLEDIRDEKERNKARAA